MSQEGPIIEARERGYGTLIRVFPRYLEIKKVWGGTKTVPMRQIQGVDLNWLKTKVTIHTHDDKIELVMVEAEAVQRAIMENMS